MHHHRWGLILLFILLYRLSDEYKAPMAFVFTRIWGSATLRSLTCQNLRHAGDHCRRPARRHLHQTQRFAESADAVRRLQGVTNLVYIGQAYAGDNVYTLSLTICMDNLAAGMGTTALVAYMASLCNVAYSATQYALLSSLMSLPRDILPQPAAFWPITSAGRCFPDCLADGAAGTFPAGLYDQKKVLS